MPGMRRLSLFSFYDPQGIVDDYVIYFLKELGKYSKTILFYSNGPLTKQSESALKDCVAEIIIRPNVGYDVLAYKEGLENIHFDQQHLYDEVLMVNHTCYGPLYPFAELFDAMEKRHCDFWGISAHQEMIPNPFTGVDRLPYHLNSYFIAVRHPLLSSPEFREYWSHIKAQDSYASAILGHEAVFTEHFTKLGYGCDTYLDGRKYDTHYPALLDIPETLRDRNPLLKRRAFFEDPRNLERHAADLPLALQIVRETSDYDLSLIWRNVARTAQLRYLNTNAALTSVLPDVRLEQSHAGRSYGRVAVCAHVYYTEMLEEILLLADSIPGRYDFIATTETEEKKRFIEEFAASHSNIENVIVRVVAQNRGRDMSSLFITCRDLFLDDRYDLVCRLHTKKSPQVAAGRANTFKRHMFENLLNSPGYTANVLDMFYANPWIGVAVPPLVHIAYPTMGHAWFVNRTRAEELAQELDLKVPLDEHTPVGAFGTMFWFRPKALRKLFAREWKWSEFNAEPHHVDGGLAHVLERLICYVAQDAGYTTQQIISAHLAGWNLAMLEYKVQKFSVALPNIDFSSQYEFLYSKVNATFALQASAADPASHAISVREALSTLLLAAKRSLAHRSPVAFKALRPFYRAVSKAPRAEESSHTSL